MLIHERDESIFDAQVDALINPVNCVGVMSKGLALEFRKRFPAMYEEYKKLCANGQIRIGKVHEYKIAGRGKTPWLIINFPTKQHWRNSSEYDYIEEGLQDLKAKICAYQLRSIAIPALGCGLGNLFVTYVREMIHDKLDHLCKVHFYK